MSYCNCGCTRELDRLLDQVHELERQLANLRYDLKRETDQRRAAIRSVREDCAA